MNRNQKNHTERNTSNLFHKFVWTTIVCGDLQKFNLLNF
jgi:hypothetical protein